MMPAAKHGDPQLGVDIHLCVVPPSPAPVPLPTPHMSIVFDPMDYIPFFGATVTVCGMKRATAGSNAKVIHIPPGFPFAPKLPDTEDEIFMGSATVDADGDPFSFLGVPVLGCQVAGMFSPPRLKKKGKKLMLLPTTFNLAIPTNVFIGGPPTISLMGMASKLGFAALGKFAKSKFFKRMRKKLFGHMKPGFLKCMILRAEPVNILTGEVSVEQEDFTLPGRIPIQWLRSYASGNNRQGLNGYGWECPADGRLELSTDGVLMHYPGVGPLYFAQLPAGLGVDHAELELMDGALLSDHGNEFQVRTKEDRIYHFPKALTHTDSEGNTELLLERISDLCDNWIEFERRNGRLIGIKESAGRRIQIVVEKDLIREVALHSLETDARHIFASFEYDPNGDLVTVRDALNKPYTFGYDAHHMLRHTDRNGLSFYYEFDQPVEGDHRVLHAWGDGGLYNYQFEYLDVLNERRITNSLGHVSVVKLDERGLPISEIDPHGGMTIYEYDDVGRTTAVVDPAGRRTEYTYDERGNLLKFTRPDGKFIKTEFDKASKAVKVTDPNGAAWQQMWDERGLLIGQKSPLGNVSRYEYDFVGQLKSFTNARNATTALNFDNVGNLSSITDALGHAAQFQYDAYGNVTVKTDAIGRQTHYRYDAKNRLTGVTLPSTATIRCSYDAEDNLTHYTDENGAETRLEYFGQGEIAKRIQPDGHTVEYLYDTEERLKGVRNQRGEVYELRRDAMGRVKEEVDYWGQSRRYSYDGSGYLIATLDPLGRRIDYSCDPLGRVTRKLMPAEAQQTAREAETFIYDANGNLLATANQHIEVTRELDAEGRLISEAQQHTQGQLFKLTNTFDANGNRIKRETANSVGAGHIIEFAYDTLDQVTNVCIDGGDPMRLQHDALGQLTHEELAPGLHRSLQYDIDGQLTGQSFNLDADGKTRSIFNTQYGYDPAGNLTSRHDSAFGKDTYLYDPMGRILKHTDPQGALHEFFNDPAGDRLITQVSGVGSISDVAGRNDDWQRKGSYKGTHYRFDRAGNLTHKRDSEHLLELVWDANQRLSASRRTGEDGQSHVTNYAYDPLGRRLYKETAGQRTWFGWDGDATTMDVIDGNAREFVYRPETFEPLAVLSVPHKYITLYVNDPNGSPMRLIDPQGQVLWAASYSAWGTINKPHAKVMDNPLRLQGQYEDRETGLYYNRHRYYDSTAGIFISEDPVGLSGGINVNEFGANTFGWLDPLGLTCWSTARKNFWKNQAAKNSGKYSPKNLARMVQGKAPRLEAQVMKKGKLVTKEVSMELHHKNIPQRVGGAGVHNASNLKAVTPWQHEAQDVFRNTGETLVKITKGVDVW
jgi:RHS repeat-associated protein